MKYIIVRQYGNGFEMNTIRPIADAEEFIASGFEVVGQYKTRKNASAALEEMGGWITK